MKEARWATWIERVAGAALLVFLIYILVHASVTAFSAVSPFRGAPIDGPCQIFDPLRRIAAGQIAGVDFQFYHGILLPFIHYPVFALFGKTIFASELSRYSVSILAFVVSLYVVFFAYSRKALPATTLATLAVVLLIAAGAYTLMFPALSLTGLRGTMPLIFFAVLLADLPAIRAGAALGLVAAVALLTSTENGLAVILAFTVAALIFALRQDEFGRYWRPAMAFIGSLVAAVLVILGCLSHFRAIGSILKFNFIEVPEDQYWFFGSAPSRAPSSWADLFADPGFWVPLVIALVLFLASLVWACLLPAKSMAQLAYVGIAMTLYALLTLIPYLARYSPEYSFSSIRICSIYVLLLAARLSATLAAKLRFQEAMVTPAVRLAIALFAIWFVALRPNNLDLAELRPRIAELSSRHWEVKLDSNWQSYLHTADALMPDAAGKTIWATYSGLLHDHLGKFNPSTDYIIHVLGPLRRADYVHRFQQVRPAYVETLPAGGAFIWEEWLHNTFWDFYQELLLHYTRNGVTNHSVIWELNPASTAVLRTVGIVAEGHLQAPVSIPLPVDLDGRQLLIVELNYETKNPWRWLPIIGRSPRFVVHWENVNGPVWTTSVALPDYRSSARFPLVPRPGKKPQIRFSVESLLPGPAIDVKRVSLSVLSLDPADFYEFIGSDAEEAIPGMLRAFSLTDANWINGVWINSAVRNQAGFFVLATRARRQTLAHASALVFNMSGRRKIQSIEKNGPYLNVFVDGPPLSPSKDGFPNPIKAE